MRHLVLRPLDQSGMTLIQVLIALGVLGIVMAIMTQLMSVTMESQRHARLVTDAHQLQNELGILLAKRCTATFANTQLEIDSEHVSPTAPVQAQSESYQIHDASGATPINAVTLGSAKASSMGIQLRQKVTNDTFTGLVSIDIGPASRGLKVAQLAPPDVLSSL